MNLYFAGAVAVGNCVVHFDRCDFIENSQILTIGQAAAMLITGGDISQVPNPQYHLNVANCNKYGTQCLCIFATKGITISKCSFIGNTVSGKPEGGGALSMLSGSRTFITHSNFTNNKISGNGAAVYVEGGIHVSQNLILSNNNATGKAGKGFGGGAIILRSGKWTDSNSSIYNNHAHGLKGGAVYLTKGTSMVLAGTKIQGCTATAGGNMYLESCSSTFHSATRITDGRAYIESPDESGDQSANCVQNIKPNTGGVGGGIYANVGSTLQTTGSVFKGNRAISGGGLFCDGCDANFNNTDFTSNVAILDGGAAFFTKHPKTKSTLSRLWCTGNVAAVGGVMYWDVSTLKDNMYKCPPRAGKAACWVNNVASGYGNNIATDVNAVLPIYGVTYGSNKSAGLPPGTVPPDIASQLLTPIAATPLGPAPHNNKYRPGVYQDVFFQLHDVFGQITTEESKGSGILAKLTLNKLNTGMPGVAVSNKGIVIMKRMEVGGKLDVVTDWTTTATWFRPNYIPGDTIRLDKQVTISSTAQGCLLGEKMVYDFDPYRLLQAQDDGRMWSLSTPQSCQAIQSLKSLLPGKKCALKACIWCGPGSYAVDMDTTTCQDCQTAVLSKYYSSSSKIKSSIRAKVAINCDQGGSYIFPRKEYWRHYAPADFIYKCPMTGACLGGPNVTTPCKVGHTGPLCAVCDQDVNGVRYANAGMLCNKCGGFNLSGDAICFFIILLVTLSVLAQVIYRNVFGGEEVKGTKALKILMKKKKIAARAKAIVGQVKVLIAYFQALIAFMMGGEATYPTDYSQLMDSFEFVNIDMLSILRGMCLTPDIDFNAIFLFNFSFPIAITLALVVHYCIAKPRGEAAEEESAKGFGAFHWNSFCMMCFMIYPNVCRVMLTMFRCHKIQVSPTETKSYLYADYTIECYEGSYTMYMMVALVGVLLYPVGIPVFFTKLLHSYTMVSVNGNPMAEDPSALPMLMDPVVQEKFGFLYGRFRIEYWWYETSEMVRKFFIGGLSMFIAPGTATQIIAVIIANSFFMAMELLCWPFKTYDDNMLMAISLVATSVTLFGALIINAQIDILDEYGEGVSTGIMIGTTVLLFLLYVAMLLRFQLPFICTWLLPECISNSPLNCYRPGGICGPPLAPAAPEPLEAKEDSSPPLENLKSEGTITAVTKPALDLEVNDGELDTLIETYFHRYDLDESGTLNSNEELQQLSTNLSFKLRLPLTGDEIDEIVDSGGSLSDTNAWGIHTFRGWFKDNFVHTSNLSAQRDAAMVIGLSQNADMNENMVANFNDGDGGD